MSEKISDGKGFEASDERAVRLAYVTTVPVTQWVFLRGQNTYMSDRGFELHAVSSPGPFLDGLKERDGVILHPVPLSRKISPVKDVLSLIRLIAAIRKIKPDIAHLSTPKAALLGAIASYFCRVPVRLFLVRGLLSRNERGIKGMLFRATERLTVEFCNRIVFVSRSLLDFAKREGILGRKEGIVIADGMSNGVDTERFRPSRGSPGGSEKTGISGTGPVVGYVGRLCRDKGVEDLAEAWRIVKEAFPDAKLLLVGPWEDDDPAPPAVRKELEEDPNVLCTGYVEDVVPHYGRMDLLVFPSRREGFPNAPMEAAAMGIPVVAFDVDGCRDAVEDGETGTLVEPYNPKALAESVMTYLGDRPLRERRGRAGRERVLTKFGRERIREGLYKEYRRLLRDKGFVFGGHGGIVTAFEPHPQPAWKRVMDVMGAAAGLIVLFPVMGCIALAVYAMMGRPVLFRQIRPGIGGKPFAILKFRTMEDAFNYEGRPLEDGLRITRLGRFLRKTSLDELPELINVLQGSMSLVGPRPLLMRYLDRYTPEQARRHDVKPGITGWAQVNGRNAIDWERKFAYDIWYVDHLSFGLDLKIIAMTVWKILKREGIHQEGQATMSEFKGTKP